MQNSPTSFWFGIYFPSFSAMDNLLRLLAADLCKIDLWLPCWMGEPRSPTGLKEPTADPPREDSPLLLRRDPDKNKQTHYSEYTEMFVYLNFWNPAVSTLYFQNKNSL